LPFKAGAMTAIRKGVIKNNKYKGINYNERMPAIH
jgi:hypothetical protein